MSLPLSRHRSMSECSRQTLPGRSLCAMNNLAGFRSALLTFSLMVVATPEVAGQSYPSSFTLDSKYAQAIQATMSLVEGSAGGFSLHIELSRRGPYEIATDVSQLILRWDKKNSIEFQGQQAVAEMLPQVSLQNVVFRENEIEINYTEGYRISILPLFTQDTDGGKIILSFEPSGNGPTPQIETALAVASAETVPTAAVDSSPKTRYQPISTPPGQSTYFSVQIGAFRQLDPTMLQSLQRYGVVNIERSVPLSRVSIGEFPTKAEARVFAGELKKHGFEDAFIREIGTLDPSWPMSSGAEILPEPPGKELSAISSETPVSTENAGSDAPVSPGKYVTDVVAPDAALPFCDPSDNRWLPKVNNKRCDSQPASTAPVAGSRAEPLPIRGLQATGVLASEVVPLERIEARNSYQANLEQLQKEDVPRPRPQDYVAAVAIPDRWRVLQSLGLLYDWYDPYNQNVLKGDFPVKDDWFFNVTAVSDTFLELRTVPAPVGLQSTASAGSNDVFGSYEQSAVIQNVALEFVYYQGDTVFKPVDWEFRFTPVFNINYTVVDEILAVNANPGEGTVRTRTDVGIQSAFVDKHLRNVSDNYDFDSLRVGIQPFSSDFRGFLFQDAPFGIRLFGNRANNKIQYNAAWFRRLDKDVNSGLNDVGAGLREDDLFIANLYWQDQPSLGFNSEFLLAYNRNRETETVFDANNFITRPASIGLERPRKYDVIYLGLGGDGHFGRLNLTTMFYWVTGKERGGVFTGTDSDVNGLFFAAEPSIDFDWTRVKLSLLYASGDSNPYDDESQAFDAIFENPIFAGADTSYWVRQATPLIGGGRVALSSRNGLLNSMRSSKEQGQSNFTNPGLILLGGGADFDVLPQLRLSFNANYLRFAETAVLEYARATRDIDEEIGFDVSAALIWRPYMTQNIVTRLSFARLFAGKGFVDLYGDEDPYSILANVVLTW